MSDVNELDAFSAQLQHSDSINSRQRLWLAVYLLIGALILSLVAVVALAMSKRTEVVPFLVNELTGEVRPVSTSVADLRMSTLEALDHFYINAYVIAAERYTQTQIEEDFNTVQRFTCANSVYKTFYENVDLASPNNYFDRYPGATVQPEIESINFFKKGGDIKPKDEQISEELRYYTVIFSRTIAGASIKTKRPRYSLIIGVDYTEKAESALKKRNNPFGFCVYSYQKTTITVKDSNQ